MTDDYFRPRKRRPPEPEAGPVILDPGQSDPTMPAPSMPTGVPTGNTPRGNITGGGPWALITTWRPETWKADRRHGVPWSMLEAMMVVESGGKVDARNPSGATGLMQIKPAIWQRLATPFGYDLQTPQGQIGMAGAILGGDVPDTAGMSPQEAFVKVYYPTPGLDVPGEDGDTPRMYLDDIAAYRRILEAAAGAPPTQPDTPVVVSPRTVTPGEALLAITGGRVVEITYGFKAPAVAQGIREGWYAYFEGRGGSAREHPGVDIMGALDSPIYAPVAGTVACAATGNGSGGFGQGCAAFPANNGVGRVELQVNPDVSLIFGHAHRCLVPLGTKVAAGQALCTVGDFVAPHIHYEARVKRGNDYDVVDPLSLTARLMTGSETVGQAYAERRVAGLSVPILLPADIPFRQYLTPVGLNRSQRALDWRGIVSHETGNQRAGADADMHAKWQYNGTPGHPDGKIGVHFYGDDNEVVQTIPVNEQGIHSGDGRNQTAIGYERAVNADGDRTKAERVAQEFQAAMLRAKGWTATANLSPHRMSNGCPAQTNATGGWTAWVLAVDAMRDLAVGPAKKFDSPLPDAVILALFPDANPSPQGTVTKLWLAAMRRDGDFYPFTSRVVDGQHTFWVFGGLIVRSGPDGVVEMKP